MDMWRSAYLGVRELPPALYGFELQAFFTFDRIEFTAIDARQTDAHRLGLALRIGFLRMSGRLPDAFRIVPPALWRHLGEQLGIVPLGARERAPTLVEHRIIRALKQEAEAAE